MPGDLNVYKNRRSTHVQLEFNDQNAKGSPPLTCTSISSPWRDQRFTQNNHNLMQPNPDKLKLKKLSHTRQQFSGPACNCHGQTLAITTNICLHRDTNLQTNTNIRYILEK
jgi:hypothetical protein